MARRRVGIGAINKGKIDKVCKSFPHVAKISKTPALPVSGEILRLGHRDRRTGVVSREQSAGHVP